jgi:putative membrane protein
MMRFLGRIIVNWAANILGIIVASYLIHGFFINSDPKSLLVVGLILTGLSLIIKPIIKLIFGPVIVLTLGLGLIVVNAIVLYLLDAISPSVSISNLTALLYAAILTGIINFLFHFAEK